MLQQSLMNFESGTTREEPRALEGHFYQFLLRVELITTTVEAGTQKMLLYELVQTIE